MGYPGCAASRSGGRPFVTGGYELNGQLQRLVATVADFDDLPRALATVAEVAAAEPTRPSRPPTSTSPGPASPPTPTSMAGELREALSAAALPANLRRITTTVAGSSGAVMHHHFTFRPSRPG